EESRRSGKGRRQGQEGSSQESVSEEGTGKGACTQKGLTMARRAALDIETYNRKRDFAKTKEPRGRKLKAKGDSFVVQKHAAARLHWDFRLELDGVLKSWAVPKGPSSDPGDQRRAMRTEDRPRGY